MRRHTFVTSALWIGAAGTFLLITTLTIPAWLASRDDGVTHLIGLFYRLHCIDHSCKIDDLLFDDDSLSLANGTWSFNPVAVPTLILLACILCCIALLTIECMDHKCCRKNVNHCPLVTVITVVLLLGGIIGTLGLLLAFSVSDKWYDGKGIEEPVEFPWAMLIAIIALILLWVSIVMFFIVVWKWYKYGKSFDQKRVMFLDEWNTGSRGRGDDYNRTEKYKKYPEDFNQYRSSAYGSSFNQNGSSSYDMSRYGSSYNDIRRSKGLPDFEKMNGLGNHSPKILRETMIASDYGPSSRYPSSYSHPDIYRSQSDPYMLESHTIDGPLSTTYVTREPSRMLSVSDRRPFSSDPELLRTGPSDNVLSKSYEAYVLK